jgi:hypothetical protein
VSVGATPERPSTLAPGRVTGTVSVAAAAILAVSFAHSTAALAWLSLGLLAGFSLSGST